MKNTFFQKLMINEETIPTISQLAERIPGGFFIYHADGDQELIYYNTRMLSLFRCATDEEFRALTRNSFKGIVHPDDYRETEKSIREQIGKSEDKLDHVKYRFIRRDGSVGVIDDYGHFNRSDTFGDIYYVFVQDISAQEQGNKELITQMAGGESLCILDLRTGYYRVLIKDEARAAQYRSDEDFQTTIGRYVVKDVFAPDRKMVSEAISIKAMVDHLEKEKEYTVQYRDIATGVPRWYEMRAVKLSDFEILYSFTNRDREILFRSLSEKAREDNFAIFAVDLDTCILKVLKRSPWDEAYEVGDIRSYSDVMHHIAEQHSGEAREFYEQLSDIDYLKKVLATENKISYSYRSAFVEGRQWVSITGYVVARNENGAPATFVICFTLLDALGNDRQEYLNQFKENMDIIGGLASDYMGLYHVNLDTGEYTPYFVSEKVRQDSMPLISRNPKLMDLVNAFIEGGLVHKDYREGMHAFLPSIDGIRSKLEHRKNMSLIFKRRYHGDFLWTELSVVKCEESEDTAHSVIVGFKEVDREVRERQEQQRSEELINIFTNEYEAAFLANFSDGAFKVISNKDKLARRMEGITLFSDAVKLYVEQYVHPADREYYNLYFYSGDAARRRLTIGEPVSFEYRSGIDGEYFWHRAVLNRISEDEVLVGLKSCDTEIMSRLVTGKLMDEYDALYLVDLNKNEIRPARSSRVSAVGAFTEKTDYQQLLKKFAETVAPQYKQDWLNFSDPGFMKKYMAEANHREYIYELPGAEKAMRRFRVDVIERDNGEAATVLFSFMGIDDLRAQTIRLQREMADQKILLDYFMESFSSAYAVNMLDDTFEILHMDRGFSEIFKKGGSREDMLAFIEEHIHPDDREMMRQFIDKNYLTERLKNESSIAFVVREVFGNKERTMKGVIIRCTDEYHVAVGFMDITEEVRQQREQQKQLQEALAMAQSANRAKTTFLNNMSHDIRTPMNAIIGYTGLAANHIENTELVKDYLSKIGQSSDHLLSLINDVLDMSRIESGKMNLDEKEENLSDIIHTLRDIVQADIRSKRQDFFIDTMNVNDEDVICDKLRLNQVLLNILSNAIKYTPAGGHVALRVTERPASAKGYASYEFFISDNGMGMSREFLETIFDPFTRAKSSTVSGIQGTGLGMAITKNIVEMMGGKIEIASEPGKGTDVTITFSFKLQSEPHMRLEIPELKGIRALVVDDDANTCLSLANMLSDIGMRDEWCTSGKEAVMRAEAAFRRGDMFRVYIIDCMMPDQNGIETTRRIRKIVGDSAPIVILTAYDWADIEEEAKAAGVNSFAAKPMFPSDLRRILNNCLGKKVEDTRPEEEHYDFRGKKVLLVEDNELNREIAEALLEENGLIVDTAEDGDIAVDKIKRAKVGDYDLILMDVQMPRMDGHEATRQIRALGTEISKLPILAMTANAFEEDRKAALEAGMNEHIAKPINVEILKATMSRFL